MDVDLPAFQNSSHNISYQTVPDSYSNVTTNSDASSSGLNGIQIVYTIVGCMAFVTLLLALANLYVYFTAGKGASEGAAKKKSTSTGSEYKSTKFKVKGPYTVRLL